MLFQKKKFLIVSIVLLSMLLVSLACGGTTVSEPVMSESEGAGEEEAGQAPASEEQVENSEPEVEPSPPTEEPSPEPTVEPTPSVPALEILSHSSYEDYGYLMIVGEIQNNSDYAMEFVEIVSTLYDENENVVGTDFTYSVLDTIPPGGKSPFEFMISEEEYAGSTSYKLQASGSNAGEYTENPVVLKSDRSYIEYDYLNIVGEVENTGSSDAEFVLIAATLYDADGNVVGVTYGYSTLDVIPPGNTSPFELMTGNYENFDHYEIQVDSGW